MPTHAYARPRTGERASGNVGQRRGATIVGSCTYEDRGVLPTARIDSVSRLRTRAHPRPRMRAQEEAMSAVQSDSSKPGLVPFGTLTEICRELASRPYARRADQFRRCEHRVGCHEIADHANRFVLGRLRALLIQLHE